MTPDSTLSEEEREFVERIRGTLTTRDQSGVKRDLLAIIDRLTTPAETKPMTDRYKEGFRLGRIEGYNAGWNECRRLKSQPQAAQWVDEWRDVSTAPSDGRLVWVHYATGEVERRAADGEYWRGTGHKELKRHVLHWQPFLVPAPPPTGEGGKP